jgi:hypothetical protein
VSQPPVEMPLPMFRQPPQDPDLPEVASPVASPPESLLGSPQDSPESPFDPSERPSPLPDPEGPTRRSWAGRAHGAGEPRQAARILAGVFWMGLRMAQGILYRRGRWFRLPDQQQMDDIAGPLGRILVRYLPLDVVGPTLVDATEAVAAGHAYTMAGPLTGRYAAADPNDMGDPE